MDSSNSLICDFVNDGIRGREPEDVSKLIYYLVGCVVNKIESTLLCDLICWEESYMY